MISVNKNIIPFFSVVITTYNRKESVKKAIESVLNQVEKDYEIIIVDDGSTDDTFSFIRKYFLNNYNIRYLFHKNRGPAQSKNVGILASSGLFVTFLDSDDLYTPHHLGIRKEAIEDNQFVDLFYGGLEVIGDQFVPDYNDLSRKIRISDCVVGGTFVAKRQTFIDMGGFPDVCYGEDKLLYDKFRKNNMTIGKIENPTYIYNRSSDDSVCDKINKTQINNEKL